MTVEDWAEIRRLYTAEGMAIKAIAEDGDLLARGAPCSGE
jgi:hypothetical protein